MNGGYLILIIVTTIIGAAAQFYVNSQLSKYQNVPTSTGLTGEAAAKRMLARYGVSNVPVSQGGSGQDYFDPSTNSITIDPHAYSTNSITAMATACHEVGHACQFNEGYALMKFRSALVPVVNLTSNAWFPFLLIGIMLAGAGSVAPGNVFINIAIALYAFAVLFHLVTLPVEFNASHRAMDYLKETGLPEGETAAAFSVLRACALTYVAAALVSVLQLLWLLGQRR
ncbi:MAG: zinc metallopeptidase [Eggerthellaceae bacterium]|nr:zinc metallopeptidase [Eggerthellaceae bacterium]